MLKNLDNGSKDKLLKQIKRIWRTGRIPDEWKPTWVCPITKPGKKPDRAQSTQPISLASVVCKLAEKIVLLARIEWLTGKNEFTTRPSQALGSISELKIAWPCCLNTFWART